MPGTPIYDIYVDRNQSYTHTIVVTDSSDSPINVSSYTSYLVVKKTPDTKADDSSALINKTKTNPTNTPAGDLSIPLSPSDLDMAEGTYYYGEFLKDPSGNIYPIKKGKYVVSWTSKNNTA